MLPRDRFSVTSRVWLTQSVLCKFRASNRLFDGFGAAHASATARGPEGAVVLNTRGGDTLISDRCAQLSIEVVLKPAGH